MLATAVDVTKAQDVAAFAAQVAATYGRVDILVNNGGGPKPGTFDTLEPEQFSAACEILLLSTVRTTKAFLPLLRKSRQGRIITVTSTATCEVIPNLMLSNSLRAAVAGWSKTLARELAPEGITVNCVAPGSIDTERNEELIRAAAQKLERLPMRRFGTPEEFAAAVSFLASRSAGSISGINLLVDGASTSVVQEQAIDHGAERAW